MTLKRLLRFLREGSMTEQLVRRCPHLRRTVHRLFYMDLIKTTNNFGNISWLGHPIWQNILDLWTIQETIAEIRPRLLIECGTNRGGSAMFYAHLFDLIGSGRVITIDVQKMHELSHPRITFLLGCSVSTGIVNAVKRIAEESDGAVMVILDSDHSADHVSKELECYASMVTPGSYILVQDGVVDELRMFAGSRPGPLPAIKDFVARHSEFEVDAARVERFLITHHPQGWLRRKKDCTTPL